MEKYKLKKIIAKLPGLFENQFNDEVNLPLHRNKFGSRCEYPVGSVYFDNVAKGGHSKVVEARCHRCGWLVVVPRFKTLKQLLSPKK
jgi:hypothetical protein